MSQLDLLLSDADREKILLLVVGHHAQIVRDRHYFEPHYEKFATQERLPLLREDRLFFVLRNDWMEEDLVMRPIVNKYKGGGFYISQREGGPMLDLLLIPEHRDGNKTLLGRGSIHFYAHYYSRQGSRVMPSPVLKAFYSELSKCIKTDAVRLKSGTGSAWLSKSSVNAVLNGTLDVPEEWLPYARDQLGAF